MNQKLEGLEEPVIPLRNDRKEIDLERVGTDDLETIIQYTGMAEEDVVSIDWWGVNDFGESFDAKGTFFPSDDDVKNGLKVRIRNDIVTKAKDGEAFYSYTVNTGTEILQSRRVFSFIGVRAAASPEGLPVALALESHELFIQPQDLDTAGVTFVVPSYQTLTIGDIIKFTLIGFDEEGEEQKPITGQLEVTKEHLDNKALTFTVGKNEFRFIDPGRAEVFYEIVFGGEKNAKSRKQVDYKVDSVDEKTVQSPKQIFVVDSEATLPGYLPEPIIDGHSPGNELPPENFRNGLTIVVKGYPDMAIADRVTLSWRSPVRDFLQTIRVDASTEVVGDVSFHIPFDYLAENQGATVRLSYLYGREGAGQRSLELSVKVGIMRVLSAPNVIDASPDAKDRGTLDANDGLSGVWVELPDVLLPGERAQVEWRGWPGYGEYTAKTPDFDNPLRFHIPAEYVPANMGRGPTDEGRRFEVVYQVYGGGAPSESDPYHLRIKPVQIGEYPQIAIVCPPVTDRNLYLSAVPEEGADLELDNWVFAREGDLIELSITGVTPPDKPGEEDGKLKEIIRDASEPVTAEEAENGIKAKLDKQKILKRLKFDTPFTLHVRLSFDGGAHYINLKSLSPTLKP
ncbi:hypothetical protein ACIPZ5_24850 [Pseudomonas sp. NPDC089428]|uniref:hypothetical protein n=1 Tax=Pseudomonas sp. NPDC089428 TaxID=3364467 RepID=UPI00380BED57